MGHVLAKFQEARTIAYADDGYVKGKLSVALQVLAELKHVLKEDAGLELHVGKTSVLPKDVSQQAAFDEACEACRFLHPSTSVFSLASTIKFKSYI